MMGRTWLLNVFLALMVVSLTVHVTFQLGVASQWQQADSSSGPRGLSNDSHSGVIVPSPHLQLATTGGALRQRKSDLLEAVVAKAAAAAAKEAKLETRAEQSTGAAAAAALSGATSAPPIPTLDCESLLRDARENRLDFRDPNARQQPSSYQRRTRPAKAGEEDGSSRTFYISLHVKTFDPVRWIIMTNGAYYEKTLEAIWRQVLKDSPPHSRVLDVGANIGYFSLVSMAAAADRGVVVDAFEPNPVNLLRTCESLALNNWTRTTSTATSGNGPQGDTLSSPGVHLHPVGVSDTNQVLPFLTNRVNPGASQFVSDVQEATTLVETSKGAYHHGTNMSVITLDAFATSRGWIGPNNQGRQDVNGPPNIAVLKVDVEALEHKVIVGATRLLQSHLVKNVFMEVSVRNHDEVSNGQLAIQVLIDAGYKLQGHGGFSGPGSPVRWPQDDPSRLISHILDEAKRVPVKQLNLWWTTK
jgi:2-polyprenyl-3-methyl-5-hydroxy-6-metoxy-1,4-benzoquinol methylase